MLVLAINIPFMRFRGFAQAHLIAEIGLTQLPQCDLIQRIKHYEFSVLNGLMGGSMEPEVSDFKC
jgi:hypothetical protein